jgi:hypothetical protein
MGIDHPREVRDIILLSGEIGAVLNDGTAQSHGELRVGQFRT